MGCPKAVTITLVGSAGTAWATDAIKKISTAILTDSDGYKMTLAFSKMLTGAAAAGKYEGGCVLAATGNAVCFRSAAYPASKILTTCHLDREEGLVNHQIGSRNCHHCCQVGSHLCPCLRYCYLGCCQKYHHYGWKLVVTQRDREEGIHW